MNCNPIENATRSVCWVAAMAAKWSDCEQLKHFKLNGKVTAKKSFGKKTFPEKYAKLSNVIA